MDFDKVSILQQKKKQKKQNDGIWITVEAAETRK